MTSRRNSKKYKEEVVGKEVWIKLLVDGKWDFYQGLITRFQVGYRDDNLNKTLDYEHFVKFGDEDDDYYDLTDLEDRHRLAWDMDAQGKPAARASPATAPTTPRRKVKKRSAVVTPPDQKNKRTKRQGESTVRVAATRTNEQEDENDGDEKGDEKDEPEEEEEKKNAEEDHGEPSVPEASVSAPATNQSSNYTTTNPEINLDEFEHWLREIHKTRNRKTDEMEPLSTYNADRAMTSVQKLVSGEGLRVDSGKYEWPDNIYFRRNQSVDLNSDFRQLKKELREYEKKYGKDSGNGWLGNHGLGKLERYEEYVQQRRKENGVE